MKIIKCTHCNNDFSIKEIIQNLDVEKYLNYTRVINFYSCPCCYRVLVIEEILTEHGWFCSEKTIKMASYNKYINKIESCDEIIINEQNEIEGVIYNSRLQF